jgi:hypothetical protein
MPKLEHKQQKNVFLSVLLLMVAANCEMFAFLHSALLIIII